MAVRSGRCEAHAVQRQRNYDRVRGTRQERGYDRRWEKYRAWFLAKHPLCVHCTDEMRVTTATVVDHIIPASERPDLFYVESNHQPLCHACHNRKTAAERAA